MPKLFLAQALLPQGWASDVLLGVDAAGLITESVPGSACPPDAERLSGVAVPGVPNLHSHAHQRAIAGLTERSGEAGDSFWSWREAMYRALDRMNPDDFQAIAAQLYVEMLKAGYTAVAEFHYLHHDPSGRPYADPAEMGHRVVRAAGQAGIGLTLLPSLYASGNFGGAPPTPGQRRFVCSAGLFQDLFDRLRRAHDGRPDVRLGIAPHSLRAVPPALLSALLAEHPEGPVHIHVAEQRKEVADCLAQTGRRPVDWLFDAHPVDARWCLIHATHVTSGEVGRIAASGAVAGLCPTTEGNLGDGIFPAEEFLNRGGRFGIGTDSQVTVDPSEDLRWMEYVQRLVSGRRAVLAGGPFRSTGRRLLDAAWAGGAQACGLPAGRLAQGHRADLVVLDPDHSALVGRTGDGLLDSWVFGGGRAVVRHVLAGGRVVIRDGRHPEEERVAEAFARAMKRMTE